VPGGKYTRNSWGRESIVKSRKWGAVKLKDFPYSRGSLLGPAYEETSLGS